MAFAAVAGAAGVAGVASPAQAAPSGCGAFNYTANWVGQTCTGGSGLFHLTVRCTIPASGGQSYLEVGDSRRAPTTVYANCRSGTWPIHGTARRVNG